MLEFFLSNPFYQQIAISITIFIAFWLFRGIFTKLIINILLKITVKTASNIVTKIVMAFDKPLQAFVFILGIFLSIKYLPISNQQNMILVSFFRSAIIAIITWGLYNLAGTSSVLFETMHDRLNLNIDKILIPFLSKMLRFVLVALALGIIAEEWGYDVSNFIAGLGLGGLAFALAAKDTLANIFAGVVVIVDKPFGIGDWIMTPSVEGTVEDITFRSVKVRTFADAIVTIPNSTLVVEPITNWTRMEKRQISFNLKVSYDTSQSQLEKCIGEIETMLVNHPEIHPETIFVKFDKFGENGLEIFFYFFTNTTHWDQFLTVKEDVNFKIMAILEQAEVDVALPGRSIYLKTRAEEKTL